MREGLWDSEEPGMGLPSSHLGTLGPKLLTGC